MSLTRRTYEVTRRSAFEVLLMRLHESSHPWQAIIVRNGRRVAIDSFTSELAAQQWAMAYLRERGDVKETA